jgi:subtilisin family serine protease
MSLEGFGFFHDEYFAILNAVGHGVVVVVAAGNFNTNAQNISPASFSEAITVSAITDTDGKCGGNGRFVEVIPKGVQPITWGNIDIRNPDDYIASYSNYGPPVDLAAPGTELYTTTASGGYGTDTGTSFAAPIVAGAAALYKSLHPTASPFQVDAFLKSVATKAPATGNPLVPCDGAGRGYFNEKYPGADGMKVFTDEVKEPLLNMANIR